MRSKGKNNTGKGEIRKISLMPISGQKYILTGIGQAIVYSQYISLSIAVK